MERNDSVMAEPVRSPLRVLLVEDNRINQRLAAAQLQKQQHTVVVADNGQQAVDVFTADRNFDVVLMDLEMPVMDGLTAARRLRELEAGSGRRVPIIAMTAHAIEGARNECMEAGMDDYVSKPFHAEDLLVALARVHGARDGAMADDGPAAFDRERALEQTGGDAGLLAQVVALFLDDDLPRLMKTIGEALQAADAGRVYRAAHDLKGVVLHFGADATASAAKQLETLGRDGNLIGADEAWRVLRTEVERLRTGLAQLRQ